jgi:hypothetical protein
MTQLVLEAAPATELPPAPDTAHLITEDDTPVDHWFSEKNQRLLTGPLYDTQPPRFGQRPFVVAANVGVFNSIRQPTIVPDVFLSLDADMGEDWWETGGRSYLIWEVGKPPDVVFEIVSNTVGGELGEKKQRYARMRVSYYVVFDPDRQLQAEPLIVYELRGGDYVPRADFHLPEVGLGLTLWPGQFEGKQATWLGWCDAAGDLIPTGQEWALDERQRAEQAQQWAEQERQRAEQAQQQADHERQRAEQAQQQAEQERTRADRLAAQLRQLGIELEA